ncbi:MAG: DUF1499 domain-containing protein [Planctomycetota bacterium]
MLGLLAIVVTAGIVWTVFSQIDDWSRDLSQNTAELTEQAQDPRLRPVVVSMTIDSTVAKIETFAKQNSAWQLVDQTLARDSASLKLTRTSTLFRFVDDVQVEITAKTDAEGLPQCVVHASSASRVGKGDLGQNPRNLVALTEAIKD